MIANAIHPTTCDCTRCSWDWYAESEPVVRVRLFWQETAAQRLHREWLKAVEHSEAIGRSRLLMVDSIPSPIVRRLAVAARDPRRVHLSRCQMRRPRLSLLARVRAELSRRRG